MSPCPSLILGCVGGDTQGWRKANPATEDGYIILPDNKSVGLLPKTIFASLKRF